MFCGLGVPVRGLDDVVVAAAGSRVRALGVGGRDPPSIDPLSVENLSSSEPVRAGKRTLTLGGRGTRSLADFTALTLRTSMSPNGALASHSSTLIVGFGLGVRLIAGVPRRDEVRDAMGDQDKAELMGNPGRTVHFLQTPMACAYPDIQAFCKQSQ